MRRSAGATRHTRLAREALAVGVAALALYLLTLQRGVSLPDSAVIMEAMQGPVVSAFACNHTLNNLIGWLVCRLLPFGTLAWRCNAVSALYGAGVIALFYALSRRLGASRTLAAACAASLSVSHGVWWHATVVENYGLSAILFLGCCHLLLTLPDEPRRLCRRLFALFFVAGLALLNHLQNGVLLVGCAAALLAGETRSARGRVWAGAGAAAGVAPFAALAAWEVGSGRAGDAWLGWLLGGGGFEQVMLRYGAWGGLPDLARVSAWHHPGPFLLAVATGLIWMAALAAASTVRRFQFRMCPRALPVDAAAPPRAQAGERAGAPLLRGGVAPEPESPRTTDLRRLAWLVWSAVAGNTVFFLGYETWDRFSFLLVPLVAAAVAAAAWLAALERRVSRQVRVALVLALAVAAAVAPFFYDWQVRLARDGRAGWLTHGFDGIAADYHGRFDLAAMLLDPVRRDGGSIERFLRAALAALPPDAVWVDDGSTYWQAAWLQRREGLRRDVRIELIAHPLLRNHGMDAHALAMRLQWRGGERWFIVTDHGPCARLLDALQPFGWRAVPFDTDEGMRLYEVERVAGQ